MTPAPKDREKNICPPAAVRTFQKPGASSMMPLATAQPGTNIYFRPSAAPGRVQERMMQMMRMKNRAGIPTEQTRSMPPPTPLMTTSMVMSMKASAKAMDTSGWLSSP